MTKTIERLISARTAMLLDDPFFGALSLRLELIEDPGAPTAWTDGTCLAINPKWAASLSAEQLRAIVAHEVMHCSQGHCWRRDNREPYRWNIACDRAINNLLVDAGYNVPENGEFAKDAEIGQSAEWIYTRLPEYNVLEAYVGLGEVRDALDSNAAGEAEWKQAVIQAANQARNAGKLPGWAERLVLQATCSRVNWRAELRRFLQRASGDYTWTKPNRRYLHAGLYLPCLQSEDMPEIAIAVDTSGSMDDTALAQARAEVEAVIGEVRPAAVTIFYADAAVAITDRFERDEPLKWRPKGGGGTDFRPVFKALKGTEAVCLIYISDLCGTFPTKEPGIPTLWVTDTDAKAPWGETIRMQP